MWRWSVVCCVVLLLLLLLLLCGGGRAQIIKCFLQLSSLKTLLYIGEMLYAHNSKARTASKSDTKDVYALPRNNLNSSAAAERHSVTRFLILN